MTKSNVSVDRIKGVEVMARTVNHLGSCAIRW
jgi:hypothetical protein